MFENIIEQDAALQLRDDIARQKNAAAGVSAGRLAPSMLFFGPPESGKGSAALELARALSCENSGEWKCACPSCESHRYLQHSDLLLLGQKPFLAEINACRASFARNASSLGAKTLFLRSIRKLQLRFSPVLIEDSKHGKLASVLQSLEEDLNEFWLKSDAGNTEKLLDSLVKNASTLANEGVSSNIPIDQIRRAGYWCRLAPVGRHKTLIIENAENMRDDARNSLLKLLEEPPAAVSIVLTAKRKEAIMPTILSRLRPYRFLKRSREGEIEILQRIFQVTQNNIMPHNGRSLLSAYLDSFLPQNSDILRPLASFFLASAANIISFTLKKKNLLTPPVIISLAEYFNPVCEKNGLNKTLKSAEIIKILLEKSGNFEGDSFSEFLKLSLELSSGVMRNANDPGFIAFMDLLKKNIVNAEASANVYNQSKALVLEALLFNITNPMANAGKIASKGSVYG